MRSFALGAVAVAAVCTTTAPARAQQAEAPKRPNVLVLIVDDLNDWVGCLGDKQAKTPHIDRLARRGVVFANAHCQAPVCNPSRTSLLTGLRPTTTGVYALNAWFREVPALASAVTLPQFFARNGYRTLSCGKVFHDGFPARATRKDGDEVDVWGFDGGFAPRPPSRLVPTPTGVPLVDWGVFPERDEEQDDWKVADWAVARIEEAGRAPKGEQPFFLAAGLRHPHLPLYATQKWFDLYPESGFSPPPVKEDDRADVPRYAWYLHWRLPEPRLTWLRASGQFAPQARAYRASISFADAQVGRILDALDRSGLAESTCVVLLSDHGYHLGEKGISGKNTLWERSTRVPLLIAGPGVKRGGRSDRPAELLDLYPTLAEACGLPAPSGLDGESLARLLRDPAAKRERPAITTHGPGNHAVRSERWRYIRYADGSEELYDLRSDPNEWTNLTGDPKHAKTRADPAKWLPARDAAPAPAGKVSRLPERRDGVPYWEGKPIRPDEPVPEDDRAPKP